jgi:hypothetical protein
LRCIITLFFQFYFYFQSRCSFNLT